MPSFTFSEDINGQLDFELLRAGGVVDVGLGKVDDSAEVHG
jgi:hypothetical protein